MRSLTLLPCWGDVMRMPDRAPQLAKPAVAPTAPSGAVLKLVLALWDQLAAVLMPSRTGADGTGNISRYALASVPCGCTSCSQPGLAPANALRLMFGWKYQPLRVSVGSVRMNVVCTTGANAQRLMCGWKYWPLRVSVGSVRMNIVFPTGANALRLMGERRCGYSVRPAS